MKSIIKDNPNIGKRKIHFLRTIIISLSVLLFIGLIVFTILFSIHTYNKNHVTLKSIKALWNEYDYTGVYESAKAYLQENPYNNTALTYYSYACFYLAVSQNDTSLRQEYLDECINNLRIALYDAGVSLIPQLQYMLGKAYFYKNTVSSYYYSDLTVKYLNLAKENGYEENDIAEYLGLSYAALGMTMESISAFTDALLVRESDTLLLSIAEQYFKAGQYSASEQYLYRIAKNSDNEELILKSMILMGNIYIEKEDYEAATKEFNSVLEKNPSSADAYYGLGVIFEKQNNIVKARAQWRQAQKLQGNHPGALKKLSEY